VHVDDGDSFKTPTVDMGLKEVEPCTSVDGGFDGGEDAGDTTDSGPICTPTSCDDLQPCTTDVCTSTGCTHTPVVPGTFCPDLSWCNGIEICSEQGICVAGVPPVVDDGSPCTVDRCDESLGARAGRYRGDVVRWLRLQPWCRWRACVAGTPPTT
jgi:hypothetical protein